MPRLFGIRMLFDWRATGQVVPSNPEHAVPQPALLGQQGFYAGPVLPGSRRAAGRHARVQRGGADVVALTVEDYLSRKKQWWRASKKNTNVWYMVRRRAADDGHRLLHLPRYRHYRLPHQGRPHRGRAAHGRHSNAKTADVCNRRHDDISGGEWKRLEFEDTFIKKPAIL